MRLSDLVTDALRQALDRAERKQSPSAEPVRLITFTGGEPNPRIDFNSNASLLEALDDELRDPSTGRPDIEKLR